ncbi:hypothetical protein PsW74_05514 [Pseudovibrio sp. W74]|nr:hypothetical protein PsW74_05514 [Pseudovibrio sp. W74]
MRLSQMPYDIFNAMFLQQNLHNVRHALLLEDPAVCALRKPVHSGLQGELVRCSVMTTVASGDLGDHSGKVSEPEVLMMDRQSCWCVEQSMKVNMSILAGKCNVDVGQLVDLLTGGKMAHQQSAIWQGWSMEGKDQILFLKQLRQVNNSIHIKLIRLMV